MLFSTSNIGSGNEMLVSTVAIIEPANNTEASDYIAANYSKLIAQARSEGISEEKSQDLVQDVFVSIRESELNGEGFDPNYGSGCMTVAQFVHGRLKQYAKNQRYRSDVVETGTACFVKTDYIEQQVVERGKTKKVKQRVSEKITYKVSTIAATPTGEDPEDNDAFQTAFAMANVSDCTDDIHDRLSIREQISACIDICDMHGIKIINIFRNIDSLADMLCNSGKKTADSLFSKLKEVADVHDELFDLIQSIFAFSAKHKSEFAMILQEFPA